MAKRKPKRRKLSEQAAWEIAVRDHPQWRKAWERGTLPDEIVGEDGEPMNPRLHLTVHTVVESQLAADDPRGVVAISRELEALGCSPHEVRHEIGRAIAEQLWEMMHEGREYDEQKYFADLRAIVDSHR